MKYLREKLRVWLGVVEPKPDSNLANEITRIRGQYATFAADYENTMHVMMELQQKFDLLTEKMGVVIVVDCTILPPEAKMVSISEDGLLGDAKHYINAVMTAEKILALNHKLLKQQVEMYATLGKTNATKQYASR